MNKHRTQKDILKRTAKLEKELTAKNYELEIEAALEKVRAVAMGMNKPGDLLDVCKILYKQFLSLGFREMRNAMVNIHDDASKSFINYDYSDEIGKSTNQLTYNIHPLVEKQIKKIRSANDAFSETYFSGKDLTEWKKFRKRVGEKDDPRLRNCKGLYYYLYSIGTGSIGISTFGAISKEKKTVLKRFRNVFQLSYQRYIDIAKAEAQARDAKIEAALERVRASSMAMHQSSELHTVITEVTRQLLHLGFDFDTSNITTELTPAGFYVWNASPASPIPSGVYIPYKDIDVINKIYLDWGIHEGIKTETFNKSQKNTFFRHYLTHTEGRNLPEERKKYILGAKSFNISSACRKEFALDVINYRNIVYTDEQNKILERFAKVFEQSYTRFLDLKKAEAQAREAEIELALERVRARTMAMLKSDELKEVVKLVFEKLKELGFSMNDGAVSIVTFIEGSRDHIQWVTDPSQTYAYSFFIPYSDHAPFSDLANAREKGMDYFAKLYPVKEKNDFFKHLFEHTDLRNLSDETKKVMLASTDYGYSVAFARHSAILVPTNSGKLLSESQKEILKRFVKVFEQSYVRFLDLQKAEAQAREAQIEAALERVRSRTMAMHQTSELQEVIHTVHKELLNLTLAIEGGSFVVINDDVGPELHCWGSGGTADTSEEVYVPHFDMPFCTNLIRGIKGRPGFFTEEFSQKEKKKYFTKLFEHKPWSELSNEKKNETLSSLGGYTRSVAVSKYTSIFIINHQGRKFTAAENDILKRFAKVFEQTYTRFLDLQKAEAQAKESQIQLALERVRARTMAMQKSDELAETASLLFKQISDLGIRTWTSGFNIWKKDDASFIGYNSTPTGGIAAPYHIPSTEDNFFKKIYEAKRSGEEFIVFESEGKSLAGTYSYMKTLPVVKDVLKGIEESGIQLPTFQINHCAFFSQGFLLFITLESYSEAHEIFKRFAKVFEQTYTRFLDLQKAEAQAREAKIEAGLERVRSRAMAMQTSEELNALIGTMFSELTKLDLVLTRSVIIIYDAETRGARWWMANSEVPSIPMNFFVTHTELPFFNAYLEGWEERNLKWHYILEGENKFITDEFLFKQTELSRLPDFVIAGMRAPEKVYLNASFNNFGNLTLASLEPLSDEHFDILLRFAKVFDLTYTRFNDLKQAEAQARESQIQLALERVRARTMAMQKSDELPETATILFQQFKGLGQDLMQMTIGIVNEQKGVIEFSVTDWSGSGGQVNRSFDLSIQEPTLISKMYAAWKEQKRSLVVDLTGQELEGWLTYRNAMSGVTILSQDTSGRRVITSAFFSKGHLSFSTLIPPDAENIELLERFAGVFDLTYTRFLDLQKAEAQAKESQIQLALERVRARTMAMQKSNELAEAAQLLYAEFKTIGLNTFLCGYCFYKEEQSIQTVWVTLPDGTIIPDFIDFPSTGDHVLDKRYEDWKQKKPLHILEIQGETNKEHHRFLAAKVLDQNANQVFAQIPDRVIFYCANFSAGYLFIIATEFLSSEEEQIIIRFAKVFELTYTRFLDLQKAEAQAKESQIQLALERVRARTMAMQHSDELLGVVSTLYEQLNNLQFDSNACNIIIIDKETDNQRYWVSGFTQKLYPESYNVPYFKHPYIDEQLESWKKGRNYIVIEYAGQMKHEFDKQFFSQTDFKNIPVEVQKVISALPSAKLSTAFFTYGALQIIGPNDLSEENAAILQRFAKVFDQTYTRFLDLQKAEAQARQAQIETAMEKVRAHSLAMQKPGELIDVAELLRKEMAFLGVEELETSSIYIVDEGKQTAECWYAIKDIRDENEKLVSDEMTLNLNETWVAREMLKFYKSKHKKVSIVMKGEERKEWINYCASKSKVLEGYYGGQIPERTYHLLKFTNGFMGAASPGEISNESWDLLQRATTVFSFAYTRFRELQNATARAREAQIQLALERVRARTMAMHKSVELAETAQVLFQQLQALGGIPDRIAIGVVEESAGVVNFWSTDQAGSHIDRSFKARLNEEKVMAKTYQAWKDNKKSLVIDLHGDDVKDWIQFAREEMGVIVKDDFIKDRRVHNFAFFSHGWILVTTHQPQLAETIQILERFASVFSLTYRRFLDLEKAEAQAREAQIEAALERVRARSMAMFHSSELHAAADVLFQQLRIFGGNIMNAGIALCKQDANEDEYWLSSDDGLRPVISIPHTEDPVQKNLYEGWKSKSEFFSIAKGGDELRAHYNYLQSVPSLKPFFEEGPDWSFPTWQKWHAAYFSQGYLFMITLEPYEEEKILVRFARVFEQAYTRFLDLKQAEIQAREAQIEAALEKVRSRSLAMHKSDDIQHVVQELYIRLLELNIRLDSVNILFFKEGSRDIECWTGSNLVKYQQARFPYADHAFLREINEAHENGQEFFKGWYTKEQKDEIFKYFFEETELRLVPADRKKFVFSGQHHACSIALVQNVGVNLNRYFDGPFSDEEDSILKRFAKVFHQAYTRFLDLQKAEAQARESQIQLALERVRARTMAMQKSDELFETAELLFSQFKNLGYNPNRITIGIMQEEKQLLDLWASSGEEGEPRQLYQLPFNEPHVLSKCVKAWKEKNKSLELDLNGQPLKEYTEFWKSLSAVQDARSTVEQVVFNFAFFSKGYLGFISFEHLPPQTIELLERFAGVFDLTYTRFLDLQKAEAQTREAQVETALERVRSKAMAMHNSADLSSAASVVFTELKKLGIRTIRSGISLQYKENRKNLLYTSTSTDKEENLSLIGWAILDDHPVLKEIYDSWMRGDDYFPAMKGDVLKSYYEKIKSTFTVPVAQSRDYEQHGYFIAFTHGMFYGWAEKPFDDNEKNILKRFASVVDLTFKRYFDLQKSEANAREAQIEASLERVRSKTMAMHNSNDVGETVAAMFAEFEHLGIHTNRCGILIFNDQYTAEVWTARSTPGGSAKLIVGKLELDAHPLLRSVYKAWCAKEAFYQYDLLDDDLLRYYTAINNSRFYPTQFDLNALPSKEFHSDFFFTDGAVFSFTNEPVAEEYAKMIKRFASVFGQTYRRYLDLQKAEAQAKEAQIEAGLERVRSRTMAMFKSNELAETAVVMFKQLITLGIAPNRLYIAIINDTSGDLEFWITDENGDKMSSRYLVNVNKNISIKKMYEGWVEKKKTITIDMEGAELEAWLTYWKEQFHVPFKPGAALKRRVQNIAYFSKGFVAIASPDDQAQATINLLERFASVFNLTYTRFLDLQKAEAQAKEAQIETGLERVRARTMAMHNSEDVTAATATMFTELEKLGIENLRCGITIIHKNKTQEVWSVSNVADVHADHSEGHKKIVTAAGTFDMNDHPLWRLIYNKWENKEDFVNYFLAGTDKEDYFKILNATKGYLPQAIQQFPDTNFQVYIFGEGAVWSCSLQPHIEEQKQIMKRFTSVFSLTFRRYQDLKKAEAQAREATIEAALEKVRGKAMAMHNSNDLSVTTSMVFTELRKLGINPIRCGVGLLNKGSRKAQLYSATSSVDGDSLSLVGWAVLSEHPVLEKIYDSWLHNEEYYPELQGDQMRSYYQLLLQGLSVSAPNVEDDEKQYGHFLPFSVGCLYAWSENPYNNEEIKILKRFATIIDLTFRRYLELQKSETNAREAVKQAALDRIRADIASMRTISDLERITPLIWNELTILGLSFIRCGVFIMDESQKLIHTFLSTPDGKAIAAFHLPYTTPGNIQKVIGHWHERKNYVDHWDESDFTQFAEILVKQNALASAAAYLRTIPHGGFYLHFLPFLQGMLYVGNTTQLSDEEIQLIQAVADAFSTAYARYEDFNRLEAAKQQVEKTLTDLKQAQTQLVQSEKMASLGELTAGIAHEIQNPLNFVNNFSDVSNELLDEMKEELAKGNIGDAIAIAEDVKQNLEKINHHGKRADGIVKGMLQHSRTSSSQKEMTDINSLADEYLRLAYHGLRAKDKSFNAKFETDLDASVGKIDIIPQEIGRVILNLINNAFYAVSEKKQATQSHEGGVVYEPSVTLTTVKDNGRIEIKVKDNGNGIPKPIVDKIFQPFFTTKPTGQGTGLGLSLAYDIVKAHGGEIKVQTTEGEGSEFVIQLPI